MALADFQSAVPEMQQIVSSMALVLPRIATAFVVLPIFSQNTVPATVRNSFFVSIALVTLPLATASINDTPMDNLVLPLILLKEMFIGLMIGLFFSTVFWALATAGGIIDTQTGRAMASDMNPMLGDQTTITAQWLTRLAAWLFMASGAFIILLDLLLTSYQLWPITEYMPRLTDAGFQLVAQEFQYVMTTAILMAAPALVLLLLIDVCFGLLNRFAQEINVLALSLPIKSWVGIWTLVLSLGLIVEIILRKLFDNRQLLELLDQVM